MVQIYAPDSEYGFLAAPFAEELLNFYDVFVAIGMNGEGIIGWASTLERLSEEVRHIGDDDLLDYLVVPGIFTDDLDFHPYPDFD